MCTCTTYLGRSQLWYLLDLTLIQTHLRGSFCWFVLEHDLDQCNLIGLPSATIDQWQLLPSFSEHFVHLYVYVYVPCSLQCRCHPNLRYQVIVPIPIVRILEMQNIFRWYSNYVCFYLSCLFHRARQHAKNVSWLRRTEYISTEFARSHGSSESAETKWAEAF